MIVPAIIPTSLSNLRQSLHVVESFSKRVQIDIVDGVFVPFFGWPFNSEEEWEELEEGMLAPALKEYTHLEYEADLMIERPEHSMYLWLREPFSRYVIHIESTRHIKHIIDEVKARKKKIGLSLNNSTPIEFLLEHIEDIDYVQFMGIRSIGAQGLPFDERVVERIKELKQLYPSVEVQVDGSVNKATASQLANAGVDHLASGSAILNALNPKEAFEELERLGRRG